MRSMRKLPIMWCRTITESLKDVVADFSKEVGASAWDVVLSACRSYGNNEIGIGSMSTLYCQILSNLCLALLIKTSSQVEVDILPSFISFSRPMHWTSEALRKQRDCHWSTVSGC